MPVTVLDAFAGTTNADPSGSPTISAGSNRVALLCVHAEHDVLVTVSTMTIGGQSYDFAYEQYLGDGVDDMVVYVYGWNEASIAAMSGTAISYTDNVTLAKRGWSFGTYAGVDQTSLPKGQAIAEVTGNNTSTDVTTTSTTGDRIVVFGMLKNPSSTFTGWDTLSEVVDLGATDMRFGVGEGNGSDGTTTVTCSVATSQLLNAIVLGASGGIVQAAMHHYRNHGKVF